MHWSIKRITSIVPFEDQDHHEQLNNQSQNERDPLLSRNETEENSSFPSSNDTIATTTVISYRDPIGFDSIESSTVEASKERIETNSVNNMRERAVPATQIGRFMGFGSLAIRMALG